MIVWLRALLNRLAGGPPRCDAAAAEAEAHRLLARIERSALPRPSRAEEPAR